MTRCDECYQRFAELEKEVATQKQIIDALVAVADKVIQQRDARIHVIDKVEWPAPETGFSNFGELK
jgi:uncharacterized coiled-coil protein SlyX